MIHLLIYNSNICDCNQQITNGNAVDIHYGIDDQSFVHKIMEKKLEA